VARAALLVLKGFTESVSSRQSRVNGRQSTALLTD
jgi:hypothetical protein